MKMKVSSESRLAIFDQCLHVIKLYVTRVSAAEIVDAEISSLRPKCGRGARTCAFRGSFRIQ
jgi:hypothetical protein